MPRIAVDTKRGCHNNGLRSEERLQVLIRGIDRHTETDGGCNLANLKQGGT